MCDSSRNCCPEKFIQQCVNVPWSILTQGGGTSTIYNAAGTLVTASGSVRNDGPDPVTVNFQLVNGTTVLTPPVATLTINPNTSEGFTVRNFNEISVTSASPASGVLCMEVLFRV